MRKFVFLSLLLLAATAVLAGGKCQGRCGGCTPRADWAYSSQDAHYIPECAPASLKRFHEAMIPMMEARKSHESAYIRERAERLYREVRDVKNAKACCGDMNMKQFKRAAKDLTKSCDRLRDISFGGTNDAVYDQMKQVEEDFIRLANLCD
ncbi:MAG: hypothetical protein NT025_09445 [bacterium]|nr:hypothetical protein [bacterium]